MEYLLLPRCACCNLSVRPFCTRRWYAGVVIRLDFSTLPQEVTVACIKPDSAQTVMTTVSRLLPPCICIHLSVSHTSAAPVRDG